MTATSEELLREKLEGTLLITLHRPEALNSIGPTLLTELERVLDDCEHDPEIRCVVLTGVGRAFCAGADLKFVHDMPAGEREAASNQFIARAMRVMTRLENLPQPVIAAVNGIATAGGMELVLCADLVIAAESARLGDGHSNYGLLPGAGASARLPRKIGLTRAKYLFFTGDLLSARDFLNAGLVNDVVPDDRLRETALGLAAKIARKSPLGLRRMKEMANEALDLTLEQGLRLELAVNASYVHSHDRNEGLAAFAERRKPMFIGR